MRVLLMVIERETKNTNWTFTRFFRQAWRTAEGFVYDHNSPWTGEIASHPPHGYELALTDAAVCVPGILKPTVNLHQNR